MRTAQVLRGAPREGQKAAFLTRSPRELEAERVDTEGDGCGSEIGREREWQLRSPATNVQNYRDHVEGARLGFVSGCLSTLILSTTTRKRSMSGSQSLEERREQGMLPSTPSALYIVDTELPPAKVAFLATLAAAQRNPNGKELVEELTRMLGNMEGLSAGGMTAEDLAEGFAAVPNVSESLILKSENVKGSIRSVS